MAGGVADFFKPFRGFSPDAKKLITVSVIAAVGDATVWFLLTLYIIGTILFYLFFKRKDDRKSVSSIVNG